jgi:hypothetical protein
VAVLGSVVPCSLLFALFLLFSTKILTLTSKRLSMDAFGGGRFWRNGMYQFLQKYLMVSIFDDI